MSGKMLTLGDIVKYYTKFKSDYKISEQDIKKINKNFEIYQASAAVCGSLWVFGVYFEHKKTFSRLSNFKNAYYFFSKLSYLKYHVISGFLLTTANLFIYKIIFDDTIKILKNYDKEILLINETN